MQYLRLAGPPVPSNFGRQGHLFKQCQWKWAFRCSADEQRPDATTKICNHPHIFYDVEEVVENIVTASGKVHMLDRILPKLKHVTPCAHLQPNDSADGHT